ncbi:MAG: DEAD/DEAH box helicase [Cyclobacteriaceae bacterium]|nr:DEAD/DEAH box helicase [Cyclobacteriaceae bacterium]
MATLDPKLLIRKAETTQSEAFSPPRLFSEMPLHQELLSRLSKKGYRFPTQIQEETLEPLLAGRDLMGIANTGTGKTAAFLIPIIEKLLNNGRSQASGSLVVVPTRELALQVEQEFKSITSQLGIYCSSFIGGTSVGRDQARLRRHHHLIIGTPGRLIDLANRGDLRLSQISTLVLDEFDRMLDMGFVADIKKIVQRMPNRQQTMLFSATLDKSQKMLIDELLNNPMEVKVSAGDSTTSQVEQDVIYVPSEEDKFNMLLDLIEDQNFEKVLIFAETKRLVDKVNKRLLRSGVSVDHIHGNKTQNYRIKALDKFKKGKVKVLVATDVAARGIDVMDITHVINYQIPRTFDSYIHRIGRTGRAGKKGKAFTFVDAKN